jgi:mannosyltransferase OCH1-like enzyme
MTILNKQNNSNTRNINRSIGTDTIWTFWDTTPPEFILRCIETIRQNNTHRNVIVVSKATLHHFLSSDDYPMFHGRRGCCEDFPCPQYLADWVRLVLLEKYGGVWFDASVICTNSVDAWVDSDPTKISMFPMHANSNIHGNWAMGTTRPGHPVLQA